MHLAELVRSRRRKLGLRMWDVGKKLKPQNLEKGTDIVWNIESGATRLPRPMRASPGGEIEVDSSFFNQITQGLNSQVGGVYR